MLLVTDILLDKLDTLSFGLEFSLLQLITTILNVVLFLLVELNYLVLEVWNFFSQLFFKVCVAVTELLDPLFEKTSFF